MQRAWLISIAGAWVTGCASVPPPAEPEPPPAAAPAPSEPEKPGSTPAPEPAAEPEEAPPAPMSWQTRAPGTAVPDAWRACSAADECKLVEVACCDHCNGGKVVSVNARHVPDAEKLRPQCGPTMCTKRACLTRASCESGACVVQAPGAP